MAALYNDGTVQYGSRSWKISTDATGGTLKGTYVCDNITINRPTKAVDRTNQIGEPSGSVGIADFVTGTATIQLASSSVDEPVNGQCIICDGGELTGSNAVIDTTIGAETFYITSVSRAEVRDGEKKITINFKKKYGA